MSSKSSPHLPGGGRRTAILEHSRNGYSPHAMIHQRRAYSTVLPSSVVRGRPLGVLLLPIFTVSTNASRARVRRTSANNNGGGCRFGGRARAGCARAKTGVPRHVVDARTAVLVLHPKHLDDQCEHCCWRGYGSGTCPTSAVSGLPEHIHRCSPAHGENGARRL